MSKFSKIFLIFLFTIIGTFNFSYAIDESTLYNNVNNSVQNTDTTNSNNSIQNANSTNVNNSFSYSETEENSVGTTVSGVSSITEVSTFTNILNIALIVVGILLILLAIAILIRLKSDK